MTLEAYPNILQHSYPKDLMKLTQLKEPEFTYLYSYTALTFFV